MLLNKNNKKNVYKFIFVNLILDILQ